LNGSSPTGVAVVVVAGSVVVDAVVLVGVPVVGGGVVGDGTAVVVGAADLAFEVQAARAVVAPSRNVRRLSDIGLRSCSGDRGLLDRTSAGLCVSGRSGMFHLPNVCSLR
jgi:hypothetical protein